jgi:uncharacterized protein YegJ (DUF2314 family)
MFDYLLPLFSFFIALFGLYGNTWKEKEKSLLKKLNIRGYIVLILLCISLFLSIYKEYTRKKEENLKKQQVYEMFAIHLWELESQIEKVEQIKDSKKNLYLKEKLNLLSKQLTRLLELYKNILSTEELKNLNNIILFIENEHLKLDTNYSNTEIITSLQSLICLANKYRRDFCSKILDKSEFCFERQGVPFMHFWDRENDVLMKQAIQKAKKTLPYILKNLDKIVHFSVKVPIPLEDGTFEHVWLKDVKYKNGYLVGEIDNYFSGKTIAEKGDILEVKPKCISDWMAIIDNKMYGNFTLFVVMDRMCEDEKKEFIKAFKYKILLKPQIPKFKKDI